MSKELKILTNCAIFSRVEEVALSQLADKSLLRSYKDGHVIFKNAEVADGFYIVAAGEIEVFRSAPSGRQQILHVLGPGEICGSVPVFQGGSFPASARMRGNGQALFVPGDVFLDMAFANPQILLDMLSVMSYRLRQFVEQVESLSLQDVPQRLLGHLSQLADSTGRVQLNCSKAELAARVGTVPETLSRALSKLSRSGRIELDGDDIYLADDK